MLNNNDNDDYYELKSASAHTPITAQQSESQYLNNIIKITPISNQESSRGGVGDIVFTKNMKDLKSEIDCKSIDLKKIEQIKISRDR